MGTVRPQQDVLAEITEKLDSIIGFMAIRGIEGDQAKVVVRLRDMGMSVKGIARVSGLTEKAVSMRLSRLKKPKAKKGAKKAAKDSAPTPQTTSAPSSEEPAA